MTCHDGFCDHSSWHIIFGNVLQAKVHLLLWFYYLQGQMLFDLRYLLSSPIWIGFKRNAITRTRWFASLSEVHFLKRCLICFFHLISTKGGSIPLVIFLCTTTEKPRTLVHLDLNVKCSCGIRHFRLNIKAKWFVVQTYPTDSVSSIVIWFTED